MGVVILTSLEANASEAVAGAAVLSHSEVSLGTGIPVAGLRNWKQLDGLPRPQRTPSGQRRYTEADCDLLTEVLRHRASGLSLSAAMAQATASTGGDAGGAAEPAIFVGLRRQLPSLRGHVLHKGG